ncbi:hypothetical protein FCM35_KLT15854 [Carex littledalei]|uniref:Uncharacterized protein n=1 Tax=Carex littledalei TaxID=544730 RepID=A0A833RHP2_9POAL|nr:hypothetical protein FCM35_KLT15854 [Carex littledalei]
MRMNYDIFTVPATRKGSGSLNTHRRSGSNSATYYMQMMSKDCKIRIKCGSVSKTSQKHIASNGKYRSMEHRAVVNTMKERIPIGEKCRFDGY